MELRQLKYFVKSAEYLNFSVASKHLYITQSTLSQQIKQLEFELGFELFLRNSRHITLTEAGEEFLPFARKTIQDAEDGVQRLHDLQHVKAGKLTVGVTYSLSTVLTEGLMEFMKTFPDIKLQKYYKLQIEKDCYYPIRNDERIKSEINLPNCINFTPKNGQIIGEIKIYNSKQLIFSQNIYTLL